MVAHVVTLAMRLSARGYTRMLRVARTIADLSDGSGASAGDRVPYLRHPVNVDDQIAVREDREGIGELGLSDGSHVLRPGR